MQPQSTSPNDGSAAPVESISVGAADSALEREVGQLIVAALNLEIAPEAIDPQAPLFGDGLGLDSIDILEIALVVSKRYGFQLRSDNEDNTQIFQSLRSLSDHIRRQRVK